MFVVYAALEESCDRALLTYISSAALIKPLTEQAKLRVAAEMSALDLMLTALQSHKKHNKLTVVMDEFK